MQGVACEGGLIAALMAERGLTGSRAVLEGKFGYYPVYHRGQHQRRDLVDGLGTAWRIEEVSVKPVYPAASTRMGRSKRPSRRFPASPPRPTTSSGSTSS